MLNQLKIGTKIGSGFALGLIMFAAIATISYRSTNQLIDASQREADTYRLLASLEELGSQIKDAETGQRGYIITGQKRFLDPYTVATKNIDEKVNDLRTLIDNPRQQRRIETLENLIIKRVAVLKKVIDLRNSQGFEAAQKSILTEEGRLIMADIRKVITEMEAEERTVLKQRSLQANLSAQKSLNSITYGVPLYSLLLILIGFILTRNISNPLRQVSVVAEKLGAGDLSVNVPNSDRQDEIGVLTRTFNQMINNLRSTTRKNEEQNWLKSNLAEFTRLLQGQRDEETVARLVMSQLAPLVEAQQGVFYLMDTESDIPQLKLLGSYAYQERKNLGNQFRLGEGIVGQCALEKQRILLTQVPNDYIRIASGLGEAAPMNIIVLPVLFENQVTAVIELASFVRFKDIHLTFLEQVSESIGVVLNTIAANTRTTKLLKQSQALAKELQHQQEELQESNSRLEEQAEALQTSELQLKEQQEELQQANEELQQLNEELEEKAELLSVQKREVEQKNQEIDLARQAIEEKATQLELSSKYKSEFLANMSHELRTPLNSLLILARLLSENGEGNLTEKQVEYSRTIYASGNDLLGLINDVLDLAKIESGTVSVEMQPVLLNEIQESLERTFGELAQDKGLSFKVELDNNLPESILTDAKFLQQILKNLLSNAFKFTEKGGVILTITQTIKNFKIDGESESHFPAIAFCVADTGIGIPPEKQKIIFEAFQQADGTTSRQYGGTGLGLSISRQLTKLLQGKIELASQLGQGSTFILYLPIENIAENKGDIYSHFVPRIEAREVTKIERNGGQIRELVPAAASTAVIESSHLDRTASLTFINEANDDRDRIQPNDRVLLIIEDDLSFARILMDMARQQGFKAVVALSGSTGLILAHDFKPDAIMLDIRLPGIDGWTVLEQLKHDPNTRHIPVHILSVDDAQQRGLQLGAIAYLQKPVSSEALTEALVKIKGFIERRVKNLLVIEDDSRQAQSIRELIGDGDVQTTVVNTGANALTTLNSHQFDCIVLDLGLPDMSGFDLIEQIKQVPTLSQIPIIVYTGKELTLKQESQLRRLAESIIIKDVRSPERLLDETALFLHRVQANLPQSKRQILEKLHPADPVLTNKKVLIVDDDVRNIYALTGLLEQYEMQVIYAENGRDALTVLQNNPDTEVILMDVMMPELDGYATTRLIRQQDFKSLPIIALTAKAMQGDREKCLEAGASDYITKPVDTEQLLSLLRVWLYR